MWGVIGLKYVYEYMSKQLINDTLESHYISIIYFVNDEFVCTFRSIQQY